RPFGRAVYLRRELGLRGRRAWRVYPAAARSTVRAAPLYTPAVLRDGADDGTGARRRPRDRDIVHRTRPRRNTRRRACRGMRRRADVAAQALFRHGEWRADG